jgi:23S rRNA (adenine2030-N6)-methyltransferase
MRPDPRGTSLPTLPEGDCLPAGFHAMNYRHAFHAGNYAEVFKHTLLVGLIRALQQKAKGFLYLDTHAGRGAYDLLTPPRGGRADRFPEWPEGIGRLWNVAGLPPALADYVALVRMFNERAGALAGQLRYYPGSPWIAKMLLRPQDRAALVEIRGDDADAMAAEFERERRIAVLRMNGYSAMHAMLPPPERRALVFIDPPFETKNELGDILTGLKDALQRFPSGVFAVWYPLTERAGTDRLRQALSTIRNPPPTWCAELAVTGEAAALRMKGCGLMVLNPPWLIDGEVTGFLRELGALLSVDAGGSTKLTWLVAER